MKKLFLVGMLVLSCISVYGAEHESEGCSQGGVIRFKITRAHAPRRHLSSSVKRRLFFGDDDADNTFGSSKSVPLLSPFGSSVACPEWDTSDDESDDLLDDNSSCNSSPSKVRVIEYRAVSDDGSGNEVGIVTQSFDPNSLHPTPEDCRLLINQSFETLPLPERELRQTKFKRFIAKCMCCCCCFMKLKLVRCG